MVVFISTSFHAGLSSNWKNGESEQRYWMVLISVSGVESITCLEPEATLVSSSPLALIVSSIATDEP